MGLRWTQDHLCNGIRLLALRAAAMHGVMAGTRGRMPTINRLVREQQIMSREQLHNAGNCCDTLPACCVVIALNQFAISTSPYLCAPAFISPRPITHAPTTPHSYAHPLTSTSHINTFPAPRPAPIPYAHSPPHAPIAHPHPRAPTPPSHTPTLAPRIRAPPPSAQPRHFNTQTDTQKLTCSDKNLTFLHNKLTFQTDLFTIQTESETNHKGVCRGSDLQLDYRIDRQHAIGAT